MQKSKSNFKINFQIKSGINLKKKPPKALPNFVKIYNWQICNQTATKAPGSLVKRSRNGQSSFCLLFQFHAEKLQKREKIAENCEKIAEKLRKFQKKLWKIVDIAENSRNCGSCGFQYLPDSPPSFVISQKLRTGGNLHVNLNPLFHVGHRNFSLPSGNNLARRK